MILIMCSVFVNHMKRIRNTNDRLVDVIVFYPKKNIKLQPVPPLMPLEALLIPVNPTNSDYHGINGGTGCNFIFFFFHWPRIKGQKVVQLGILQLIISF